MAEHMERALGRIEQTLAQVLEQTKRTNGRLTTLEARSAVIESKLGKIVWTGTGIASTLVVLWTIGIKLAPFFTH